MRRDFFNPLFSGHFAEKLQVVGGKTKKKKISFPTLFWFSGDNGQKYRVGGEKNNKTHISARCDVIDCQAISQRVRPGLDHVLKC